MRNLLGILMALALMAMAVGCNTNGCLENRNSVPKAGFYGSADVKAMTLDSVAIVGLGMADSLPLSAAGQRISSIYLPMRSTETETGWVFQYKWKVLDYEQLYDTLVFRYDSAPFFSSNECGVIFKYHITSMQYTRHLIDSIALVDSLITNVDIEQIKIYFRTAEEEEPEDQK